MQRRHLLHAAGAAVSLAVGMPVRASTQIVHGYTATTDYVSLFAAVDNGFFAKRGLQVQPQLITNGSTIPAALQSGSLQIAGPSCSAYLQAVDAGLDLVVLGGGGSYGGGRRPSAAILSPAGVSLSDAKEFVGKKVGIPGLGGVLHVTFRAWLIRGGVDPRQVRYVEMPFAQQADVLKSGAIDAVVSVDPFLSRVVESGVGRFAVDFSSHMPDGLPTTVHAATRTWAQKNLGAVAAFQEALAQGAVFANDPANDAEVRSLLGKYNRVPADYLPKVIVLKPSPVVTAAHLNIWADLMDAQGMLKKKPDAAQLIFQS